MPTQKTRCQRQVTHNAPQFSLSHYKHRLFHPGDEKKKKKTIIHKSFKQKYSTTEGFMIDILTGRNARENKSIKYAQLSFSKTKMTKSLFKEGISSVAFLNKGIFSSKV